MFKLLFLFALAYFIYRSFRNLVSASLGPGPGRTSFGRPDESDNVDPRRSHHGQPVQPPTHPPSRPRSQHKEDLDIEDAEWKDL